MALFEDVDAAYVAWQDAEYEKWLETHPYSGLHCPHCGADVVDIHGTHETFGDYDYLKCEEDCGWEEW